MIIEPRGQLTCTGCLRSIVISSGWLTAASKRAGGASSEVDLSRLVCRKCGARDPNYIGPIGWSQGQEQEEEIFDTRLKSEIEDRESPYDFYYHDQQVAEDGSQLGSD